MSSTKTQPAQPRQRCQQDVAGRGGTDQVRAVLEFDRFVFAIHIHHEELEIRKAEFVRGEDDVFAAGMIERRP